MAVVLASITPPDLATDVGENTPVVIDLTDSTDMDPDLVEVVVNGQSCTIANDGLEYAGGKTIFGGAVVDDFLSLTFWTVTDWFTASGEDVTVVVDYNSSTISTTSFTVVELCTTIPRIRLNYEVFRPLLISVVGGTGYYYVTERPKAAADGYYYVAFKISEIIPQSAIVGEATHQKLSASTVVYGHQGEKISQSVIVQGWMEKNLPASVITGVVFKVGHSISAIVGVETLAKLPASATVYGVLRDTVFEVSVADDDTRALLEAIGVTFG